MKSTISKIPKLISVEGNIGSGKSTLLKFIVDRFPNVKLIDEPVQDWMDTDLLGLYYKDPQRWAFTFQTYCLFSRIRAINKQRDSKDIMISERSIEADRQIFAKLLRKKGYINDTEWKLYESYFFGFKEQLNPKSVDIFLYLRTRPETCFDRIVKRARTQQGIIPLDYLKSVNERHEEWLGQNDKVLILDGDRDFENSNEALEKLLKKVEQQVNKKLQYSL